MEKCHICSGYCSDYEEKKVITIKKGSFFSREVIEVRICDYCGEGLEKFGFDNKFVHLIIKEKDLINNKDAVIKHTNLLGKKSDAELKKWEKEEAREKKELVEKYGKNVGKKIYEGVIDEEDYVLKKKIIDLLTKKSIKMTISDITAHIKSDKRLYVKRLLEKMHKDGDIDFAGSGRYFIYSEKKKESKKATPKTKEVDVKAELKKYKGMLDDGLITQEQYDAKSNELLGL